MKLKFTPVNADAVPVAKAKNLVFDKNKNFVSLRMIEWSKLEEQFLKSETVEMILELKVKQYQ